MKILGVNFGLKSKKKPPTEAEEMRRTTHYATTGRPSAVAPGGYRILFTHSYNGEKDLGEIGPIKSYRIDYAALTARSWDSYLTNDITHTVLGRSVLWTIGKGLRLQVQPVKALLKLEGINIDQSFNEAIEAYFSVWAMDRMSSYSNMANLAILQSIGYLSASTGGDVLIVLRYNNNMPSVQLIDGAHIISPNSGDEVRPTLLPNGNVMKNGIEMTPTGEHVAYMVRDMNYTFERIACKGENSGMLMAFMVYGKGYRIDNVRGLSEISTALETLKKLDRYREATIGSAEERQKIPFFIEHGMGSTGENPLATSKLAAKAFNVDGSDEVPFDINGNAMADKVAVSTNKQVFNMPRDSKMVAMESKNELYYKDFTQAQIESICAAVNIPADVAMSKYTSNFSASRAALKDWEHTLEVNRAKFAFQFMQPIYNFFLEVMILQNKVQAPGYLQAKKNNNQFVLSAYRTATFVGASVPHIDPLKEVQAVRGKLGDTSASIPLITVEQAVQSLNGGDSDENMEQYSKELAESKALGIEVVVPVSPVLNQ